MMIHGIQHGLHGSGLQGEAHEAWLQSLRSKFILVIAAAAFMIGFSACSGHAKKVEPAAPVATTDTVADSVAHEADATYFVDVEFQKGSNKLTEQSGAAITALLNRARAAGELNDVKVLSWADEEYPSAKRKKLSRAERTLAASRNRAIETHIRDLKYGVKVEAHNMAERPSAFSRWFNTTDARFKRSLVAAGLPTTAEAAPVTGRASHSVIVVTLK